MTHRPLVLAVPVMVGGLVLGGCTLGGQEATEDGTGQPATAAVVDGAGNPATIGETVDVMRAAAGEGPVGLSGDLPVLATRQASSSRGDYEVALNGVAVQDELMTVVFTVTVLAVGDGSFGIGQSFDDGRQVDSDQAATGFTTDGVYVLDPAAGTRHLVAYDSEGQCVCSTALNRGGPEVGGALTLSATFAAPPESTTTVDVVIPTVGAFTAVPLER